MNATAETVAEPIDTGATVQVPDGEVSREALIKIIEDGKLGASEDAAEPQKPAEPAKDPAKERVSARIIASRRAELKANADRQALAKERADLEASKAAIAEQTKLADQLKAAKLSPSRALELLGMTPKEFLESLATEHEPEAVAKRAVSAEQAEREKLAAEVASLKQALEAREKASRDAAMQQEWHAIQEGFLDHISSAADQYPALTSSLTPREIAERGWQVATKHTEEYTRIHGEPPSDAVIADFLEKQRAEELSASRTRFKKPAQQPSQGTPAIQGQPATANTPRTLTNEASSQRGSAAKPWSQKDADEESIRLVEAMLKPAI